jgi:hypothetical protein
MDGLLSILRAAHCRNTHHCFAIDALRHVRTDPGRQLVRLLLKHHASYLAGAKDPDTRFRDFQNHVVHVADSNWGGAPRAAERWYGRLQQFLRAGAWADAAHAAGVLSHYFTDPLQPLHTAQSPREGVVHRPLEWSIYQSYDRILSRWRDDRFRVVFRLSSRSDWLASVVLRGAELAHRSYDTLVATYDLEAARRDPREGLSQAALDALAELFGVAILGWSRVLERTALEADGNLPTVSLVPSAILSGLRIPLGFLLRNIESARERRQVCLLLEHYHTRGEIGEHLPDEVRLIRKVLAVRDAERGDVFSQTETAGPVRDRKPPTGSDASTKPISNPDTSDTLRVVTAPPRDLIADSLVAEPSAGFAPTTELHRTKRTAITLASPLASAPSIGPKTAARFEAIGILNIGQFLGSSPERMVAALRIRWIDVQQIADWQSQTRLMMSLGSLRVRDAQMLVGAGCRTTYLLETADAEQLHPKILLYAATPAGKRNLRGSQPPSIDEVREWIHQARSADQAAA